MVIVVITFIYPIILIAFGAKLTAQLVGGYIGFILWERRLWLWGICFGYYREPDNCGYHQLRRSPVMWIADGIAGLVGGIIAKVLGWVSLLSRYEDFNQGVLGLSPIVYYISFIAVFLFATVMVIEKDAGVRGDMMNKILQIFKSW